MDNQLLKKLYLIGIKYGPSIMALTCCLKLFCESIDGASTSSYENITHSINIILNLFIIGMFYITGIYFHYCWKHQSLCRIATWGYVFYTFFIIFKPSQEITLVLTSWYLIFTFIVTLGYKKI